MQEGAAASAGRPRTTEPRLPTITLDPLQAEDLKGLEEPEAVLEAFNRLQQEARTILASGITLANFRQAVLQQVEIVTPDEWLSLPLENSFADAGSAGSEFAVLKTHGGHVRLREVVSRGSAPADGTLIAQLPAGYAPSGTRFITGVSTGEVICSTKVQPSGRIEYRSGDPTAFLTLGGSWIAADKSLPAWPTPVRVRLASRGVDTCRLVLVLARSKDTSAGVFHPVSFPSPVIEQPQRQVDFPVLVLPRIDGLQPLTRYTLTLVALLE